MTWNKDDADKPDLTYLPYSALSDTALVCAYGAEKYSRDNWRGGRAHRYVAAALRHLHAWGDEDYFDTDQETGLSHLAHAAASVLFAIELEKLHATKEETEEPEKAVRDNDAEGTL